MRLLITVLFICLLSMGVFAQTSGSPGGLVVFETFTSELATDAKQAGVLAGTMTTQTVLFATASSRLARNLGVAISNPNGTAASMTLTLRRGGDGTISSVKTLTVGARQQVSRFISELFSDVPELQAGTDGSLTITSDIPVAIVALRFRETNFSTIPITSLSSPASVPQIAAGVGGPDAVILPQFASGGIWSSEIVISNTTTAPKTVRIDLFKQDGTPLTTVLNGQTGSSFQNLVIPAEGILIETNDDKGAPQVGYAIVTPVATSGTGAPTVILVDPANLAQNVALNKKITATFSQEMDPLTINSTTFTVQGITGTVAYDAVNRIATFTPTTNLASGTTYNATITTGARDLSGRALASNFVWSFSTGSAPDTTLPTVISVTPPNLATGVALNTRPTATFSEAMDPLTINTTTFLLTGPGVTPVTGTVTYDAASRIATFTPTSNLASGITYTATITTGAKDLAGNALGINFAWSFTTGLPADTTAPTVISVTPTNLATGVALNTRPTATFSEAMDPLTINTTTFTLRGPGATPVTGTVTYDAVSRIATFTPTSNLASGTTFTATITTGARDLAGNPLASNFVWSFNTNASLGPPTVDLGAAAPYGILAGAGVTNSGPTIINGNLGTSPTGTLTGFPPGIVNGTTNLANPAAAAAKLALTAAYNDAAGRSLNAISLPGDLSGLTLAPGLYKNSSSVMLSAGNVTLDAQGDPNATWIFTMGSTLTTLPGTQVILAGGAKASNIFWAVGSSATLGTTSIFKGNVLAAISISVNTGAVVEGRLLTQTGAVTLLSNIVTVP